MLISTSSGLLALLKFYRTWSSVFQESTGLKCPLVGNNESGWFCFSISSQPNLISTSIIELFTSSSTDPLLHGRMFGFLLALLNHQPIFFSSIWQEEDILREWTKCLWLQREKIQVAAKGQELLRCPWCSEQFPKFALLIPSCRVVNYLFSTICRKCKRHQGAFKIKSTEIIWIINPLPNWEEARKQIRWSL